MKRDYFNLNVISILENNDRNFQFWKVKKCKEIFLLQSLMKGNILNHINEKANNYD